MLELLQYERKPETIQVIEFNGTEEQAKEIIEKYNNFGCKLELGKSEQYGFYIDVQDTYNNNRCWAGCFLVLSGNLCDFNNNYGIGVVDTYRTKDFTDMYYNRRVISENEVE